MSKPLWSIPVGDLSFEGPRLPTPAFWGGVLVGAIITGLLMWWL